jgi:hypothetical protein
VARTFSVWGPNLRRRLTVSEKLWPDAIEFVQFLEQVAGESSVALLKLVWRGFDSLSADLQNVDLAEPLDDLERDLTQLLEKRVRREMTGFEAFELQHGPYERESRKAAPAQPPQYDLAFTLRANERIMWPLEAKVLVDPAWISPYVADLEQQYLTFRYAPFSREGAMLGYLLSGDPVEVFTNLTLALGCSLATHSDFARRDHRISDHVRQPPLGKAYPSDFRCHHMIFRLGLRKHHRN